MWELANIFHSLGSLRSFAADIVFFAEDANCAGCHLPTLVRLRPTAELAPVAGFRWRI